MAVMPPRRSHSPSEWANTAAFDVSPSRNTRSSGTNTSSNTTNPSGMRDPAAHRVVADVVALGVVRGVDDAHARRAHRDRAGDGVVLLARLHGLGRHHQQVVAQRGRADVQLGAPDHDAVATPLDDVDVGVGVDLLGRGQRAVALGVGDALGDADVGGDGVVDVGPEAVLVHRVDAVQPRRRGQQRHQRLVGDVEGQVHLADHAGPLPQLLGRRRGDDQRVGRPRFGRVAAVVAGRDGPRRHLEGRLVEQVLDPAPLEVGHPIVVQRRQVLLTRQHRCASLPRSPAGLAAGHAPS